MNFPSYKLYGNIASPYLQIFQVTSPDQKQIKFVSQGVTVYTVKLTKMLPDVSNIYFAKSNELYPTKILFKITSSIKVYMYMLNTCTCSCETVSEKCKANFIFLTPLLQLTSSNTSFYPFRVMGMKSY